MTEHRIDHIVIAAPTLDSGEAFVRKNLGVSTQSGGRHTAMGTHNRLLSLGESAYLEVIAPDPEAPAHGRPRWFGLDRLGAATAPALASWVIRVDDIEATAAAATEALGPVRPMSRGDLNWLITIPDDGEIPLDGVAPALIEWRTRFLPAQRLDDAGLRLAGLEIVHPQPDRIEHLLYSLSLLDIVSVVSAAKGEKPHLRASVDTPRGLREL
jgi:hypothetical protein